MYRSAGAPSEFAIVQVRINPMLSAGRLTFLLRSSQPCGQGALAAAAPGSHARFLHASRPSLARRSRRAAASADAGAIYLDDARPPTQIDQPSSSSPDQTLVEKLALRRLSPGGVGRYSGLTEGDDVEYEDAAVPDLTRGQRLKVPVFRTQVTESASSRLLSAAAAASASTQLGWRGHEDAAIPGGEDASSADRSTESEAKPPVLYDSREAAPVVPRESRATDARAHADPNASFLTSRLHPQIPEAVRSSALNPTTTVSPVASTHSSEDASVDQLTATVDDEAAHSGAPQPPVDNRRQLRADAQAKARERIQELYEMAQVVRDDQITAPTTEEPTLSPAGDADWYVGAAFNTAEAAPAAEPAAVPRWMAAAGVAESRSRGDKDASADDVSAESDGRLKLEHILSALEAERGVDVAVLDVRRKSDWTDTIVVVTARSTKQLFSLVDAVRRKAKKFVPTDPTLRSSLTIEGASSTDWMVLDVGRFVVHSFTAAARAHYDIEGLWNSIDESPLATSAVSVEYVEWREREETRRMLAAVQREWAGRSRATVKTKQLEEGDFMSEGEMIARLNAGAVTGRAGRRREEDLGI
ncbi:Oligomerization domain-containing protein [Zopfochytrium polystomum]|nr:Oligomerization domain-containing protein [Zopfochytrium polystomum]